eukprot:6012990-Karenia_brevis.AAC.1
MQLASIILWTVHNWNIGQDLLDLTWRTMDVDRRASINAPSSATVLIGGDVNTHAPGEDSLK